jgi:hypothetical protein
MLFLTTTILVFGLVISVIASPILAPRQNETTTTTDPASIFKPDTLTAIQAITRSGGISGGIVAYTSPKGDGVLTFGNQSVAGDPITHDVSKFLSTRLD